MRHRLDQQQEAISQLNNSFAQIVAHFESNEGRLQRHAEAIRELDDAQKARIAALDQVAAIVSGVRTSVSPADTFSGL
jgi:hypothetical protein